MNKYESQLYKYAPWTKEVLTELKSLNDGSFLTMRTGCCLLYTSPSPRDAHESRVPSSA